MARLRLSRVAQQHSVRLLTLLLMGGVSSTLVHHVLFRMGYEQALAASNAPIAPRIIFQPRYLHDFPLYPSSVQSSSVQSSSDARSHLISSALPTIIKQSPPSVSQSQMIELSLHAEEVLARLQGVMDTSEQAEGSDRFVAVQMTTCFIVLDGDVPIGYPNAQFVYQEQALMEQLGQPYRQRFLAITPDPETNSVQSITLRPPNPEQWVGLCDRSDRDRAISPEALGETTCRVFLRPSASGYIGQTPVGGCPASVRGAVRMSNTILLHGDGMDTWDRGFDADGNQVWGATTTPYQYRWSTSRSNP